MTEILKADVNGYQLQLPIQLRCTSKTGWPVYDLDILLNGQRPYELEALPLRSLIGLTKAGLALLDQWCKDHPHSFLVTYDWTLATVFHRVHRWGATCDGRLDTWFTCINDQGQRTLYPGVLNLIEDCLNICDLWRVAKDTNYFLGHLETPVDWLNGVLAHAGLRNLLESGYVFEAQVQSLFTAYSDRFRQAAHPPLQFAEHSLGERKIYVVEFKSRNEPGVVEYQFFYGNCLIAGLQPQQLWITQRALSTLLLDNDALEANPELAEAQAAQLAQQLLQLDPAAAHEVG